ncbi:MAG: tubulin-like doman-containing protein [Coriobacteriia bacterium]|nr:tubulin-like doman-containing protein [Coriobacteriia bacterium]
MAAPTLIVGVGGVGSDIVGRVMKKLGDDKRANVAFVVFDTDANDLRRLKNEFPRLQTVQTSPAMTVQECLGTYEGWEKWFPSHPVLMPKDLTQGAGQVRAISRLAFETTVTDGKIEPLHDAIKSLHGVSSDELEQAVRVVIISTIAGGTGSGLLLPLGLYLRHYFKTVYHKNSVIIRGQFVMPDVLTQTVIKNDERQRRFLEANAYATIRELDAFIRKGDGFDGTGENYATVTFDIPVPGTKRREEYPPLLPYDFIFLTDAQNFKGKVLGDKDTYYDYVAQCVYASALTPVGQRSNSAEDNMIRETIRNNGRSRYCGAGVSRIVYPFEEVRDYIAFGWALGNIADEWLAIDDKYLDHCREMEIRGEDQPDKSEFYVSTLQQLSKDGGRFFENIFKQTYNMRKTSTGGEEPISKGVLYMRALKKEIEQRIDEDKSYKGAKDNCENAADIELDQQMESICDQAGTYYTSAVNFHKVAKSVSSTLPFSIAGSLFSFSDPKTRLNTAKDYDPEKWLMLPDGGCIHPSAARYVLYDMKMELQKALRKASSQLTSIEADINEFLDPKHFDDDDTPEVESFHDRVRVAAGGTVVDAKWHEKMTSKVRKSVSKDKGAEATSADLEALFGDVSDFVENVKQMYSLATQKVVFERALSFINGLTGSYDSFYGQIRRQISMLEQRRFEIEESAQFNATAEDTGNKVLTSTVRYVCADYACLKRIEAQTFCSSNASKLPGDVCESIYLNVLRYSDNKMMMAKTGASESDAESKAPVFFAAAFEDAVLNYWRKELVNGPYSALVDMDIIDAMRAEGRYRRGLETLEDQDIYAREVFNEGKLLAEPMLENPHGVQPRPINACLYSEDLLGTGGDSKGKFVQSVLNSYNGTKSDSFSSRELLIYKSVYGLTAAQIPKFTPASSLSAGVQGGNYYKSYMDLITGIGPVSRDNSDLTPHLDTRWHWPFSFPNLEDEEEARQKARIVRAFIYGLAFGKIHTRSARPRDIYELRIRGSHDFTVSNGTPCDFFYEVFDALNINPPYVRMLIEDSDETRRKEAESGNRDLATCGLVKNLGCTAFGDTGSSSYFSIREFDQEEDEPVRRSLFEIPLLYKVSAPPQTVSNRHVDEILDALFVVVKDYFSNLVSEDDIEEALARFYNEQYELFEKNLKQIDKNHKDIARDKVVNSVRFRLLSWFEEAEMVDYRWKNHMSDAIRKHEREWEDQFKKRDILSRSVFLDGNN